MARSGGETGDLDNDVGERLIRFILTLIVATVIAVASIYVLSAVVLGPGGSAPAHRAAVAALRAHS